MFKVNKKDTRKMSLKSIWCLHCNLEHVSHFFIVSTSKCSLSYYQESKSLPTAKKKSVNFSRLSHNIFKHSSEVAFKQSEKPFSFKK